MRINHMLTALLVLVLFSACGSDPIAEGEKAFQAEQYLQAAKFFNEAKKKDPTNTLMDEKIALCYMRHGESLYNKAKNIKALSGNFEKGVQFIPEKTSDEFKKEYSRLLFILGEAYNNTKPENDIQKSEYLENTLNYLDQALYEDENNKAAEDLLQAVQETNFEKMFTKGQELFDKAQSTKNDNLYLTSEYYLNRANKFAPEDDRVSKLLSQVRAKSISVPNISGEMGFAIADYDRQPNSMIVFAYLQNYISNPTTIDPKNFELMDFDGNTYPLDPDMMAKMDQTKLLRTKTIKEMEVAEGIIAFKVPKNIKLEYIGYLLDSGKTVKKYFP
jgi:hypothetical protein